jgi:hypothetical protein
MNDTVVPRGYTGPSTARCQQRSGNAVTRLSGKDEMAEPVLVTQRLIR